MKLSVKEFLDTIQNPRTRKGYKQGIKKFIEYYGKTAEEILNQRKDDLTQESGENLIEFKNRSARFSKEIEKFHGYLLDKGFATNSARNFTIGIRQLFRFYQMPVQIRAGSKVTKTVKTSKSFPLRIEHVRKMFAIADIRERVILSMATDLGLRVGDFIAIKKDDLPSLDQQTPIPFDTMTGKEEVVAYGFLSQETVDLLKSYLPTLTKKENPYLFPSNGKSHISDEWTNKLLQRLANKVNITIKGKSLTFHCFRKMFLSASIDSGIGLTAGKKLVGKAIAQSDDTYLTTLNLKKKFIQLKKFHTIRQQPKVETQPIEDLKKVVNRLQEDLMLQKQITNTITEENLTIKREFARIQPVIEFINNLEYPKEIKSLFELSMLDSPKIRSINPKDFRFNKVTQGLLDKTMKEKGITKTEALNLLLKDNWNAFSIADKKRMKEAKARGVPITKDDYKEHLRGAIKKYQRRLDKIYAEKDDNAVKR